MKRNLTITILILLVALVAGMWYYLKQHERKEQSQKEAVILLEQIRAVSKLITVEANYSELYTYKDYKRFNWKPFRKKALLRIRGKVLAGVDLSGILVTPDPEAKRIDMGPIPKATLLAVEQDIDYYDINQGAFNRFSAEDYTRMQQEVKSILLEKAGSSNLISEANSRCQTTVTTLQQLAAQAGWTLKVIQ